MMNITFEALNFIGNYAGSTPACPIYNDVMIYKPFFPIMGNNFGVLSAYT